MKANTSRPWWYWIARTFVAITGFRLLLDDWRGYLLSFFALVFVANIYISLFSRLRVDIRSERAEADVKEKEKEVKEKEIEKIETELSGTRSGGRFS